MDRLRSVGGRQDQRSASDDGGGVLRGGVAQIKSIDRLAASLAAKQGGWAGLLGEGSGFLDLGDRGDL